MAQGKDKFSQKSGNCFMSGSLFSLLWPKGNELGGLPNPLKFLLEPRRITPLHREVIILKGTNLKRWRAWYLMHACKFMHVLHPLFNPIGILQGQQRWPIEQLKKLKSNSIKWFAQVQKHRKCQCEDLKVDLYGLGSSYFTTLPFKNIYIKGKWVMLFFLEDMKGMCKQHSRVP